MNTNDQNITAKIVTINGNKYNINLNTRQSVLKQFEEQITKAGGNTPILDRCALLYNGRKLEPNMTPDNLGMENNEYLDLVVKS